MSNLFANVLRGIADAVKPAAKDALQNFRDNVFKNALGGKEVGALTPFEIHEAMLASCKLQRALLKSGRFKISSLGPGDVHDIERTVKLLLLALQSSRHGHIYQQDIDEFLNRFYRTVEQTGDE